MAFETHSHSNSFISFISESNDAPAPIVNEAYAKRLEGSAIYKALALSGGGRTTVERGPGGYGRKKRQSENEAEVEPVVEPATGEYFFLFYNLSIISMI